MSIDTYSWHADKNNKALASFAGRCITNSHDGLHGRDAPAGQKLTATLSFGTPELSQMGSSFLLMKLLESSIYRRRGPI